SIPKEVSASLHKNRTLDKCRILSLGDKAPLTGEDYNNPLFQVNKVSDEEPKAPVEASQLPGQAPSSPDYLPGPEHLSLPDYVPRREYPEYLVPSDDEAPIEDQPLLVDASPTALSPSYVANFDMEEDPEEDLVDYPADGGEEELEEESSGMI
ncbi:hypothetical protein Tco_0212180, partial [Tanacetum coccineum]